MPNDTFCIFIGCLNILFDVLSKSSTRFSIWLLMFSSLYVSDTCLLSDFFCKCLLPLCGLSFNTFICGFR